MGRGITFFVFWMLLLLMALDVGITNTRAAQVSVVPGVVIVGQFPFMDTLTVYEGDSVIIRTKVAQVCVAGDTVRRYWLHAHGPVNVTQTPFRNVVRVRCGARPAP